jgi:uncharacterized protein (DUF433 family)
MAKDYIEKRGSGYYIVGRRVSLDPVVYGFLDGLSAEGIFESFPTLSLEQVHGSMAYYLANRKKIDAYLAAGERKTEKMRKLSRAQNPMPYRRLSKLAGLFWPTRKNETEVSCGCKSLCGHCRGSASRRTFDRLSDSQGRWTRSQPNSEVLRIAGDLGRLLVTDDRNAMPGHLRRFIGNHSRASADAR